MPAKTPNLAQSKTSATSAKTKTPSQEPLDYPALSAELDSVLSRLQMPDIAVDDAVALYERGLVLVAQLEQHVRAAENSIERLKLQPNDRTGFDSKDSGDTRTGAAAKTRATSSSTEKEAGE